MKEKWIEAEQMKRLTMDNLEEMGMFSLAHNCCYIDENGNTRYRDFEIDIDARELAKGMLKEMTEDVVSFESDEDFDDWMGCYIGEDGICTQRGLIATFYQNLWAMAELREKLKYYEDLEEQGRLLVLPCKVGDTVYEILEETVPNHYFYISEHKVQDVSVKAVKYADEWEPYDYENLYFTREEAEAALEKRRKDNKEYSEKFDELRKNRIRVSLHKYGSVADNYGKGFVQAIPSLEKCLDKYKETGNTEYLCDLANYAMFEFMYPQHPKGHFRATDSRESAGIVGLSVNEAKGIKSW